MGSGRRYYWSDLIDRNLFIAKDDIIAYRLPSMGSPYKFIFDQGDPVPVDSYVIAGNKIWVMIDDYINGGYAYIPLTGSMTGDSDTVYVDTLNSALLAHGVYTVEYQEQNKPDDANPFQSVISAIKGIGGVALIGLTVYAISKFSGNDKRQ